MKSEEQATRVGGEGLGIRLSLVVNSDRVTQVDHEKELSLSQEGVFDNDLCCISDGVRMGQLGSARLLRLHDKSLTPQPPTCHLLATKIETT